MWTFFVRLRRAGAFVLGRCFVIGCAAAAAAAVLGCSDLCSPGIDCGSGGGTTVDAGSGGGDGVSACPEDPATGPVEEACGVWVSASLGDDAHPGTRKHPVATLARAVDLAEAGKGRVYACAETFEEAVILPRGVSLFGGFDCADDWQPTGALPGHPGKHTLLAPGPDQVPLTLSGHGAGESLVYDLVIRAAAAEEPGGSSIGVLAETDSQATLVRCEIAAGDGADGAPGEHGGSQPAASGPPGTKGSDACSADTGAGGPAVQITCDDASTSTGGPGGDSGLQSAESGGDGAAEPPGAIPLGEGGYGESTFQKCADGSPGADGEHGTDGPGGQGVGRLTKTGFEGVRGKDGGHGKPGQGGGGGGASLGKLAVCGPGASGGAGGGSGGAGGCGGKGGRGGQGGGASIGVATRSAAIRLGDRVLVSTGNGGRGGVGGSAQVGGGGGTAGPGGAGMVSQDGAILAGCAGMFGGWGGNGGHGGGGTGGPSIGVAYSSDVPPLMEGLLVVGLGKGGPGGWSGNPGFSDGAGQDGEQAEVLALTP